MNVGVRHSLEVGLSLMSFGVLATSAGGAGAPAPVASAGQPASVRRRLGLCHVLAFRCSRGLVENTDGQGNQLTMHPVAMGNNKLHAIFALDFDNDGGRRSGGKALFWRAKAEVWHATEQRMYCP
jgi:hypothetical protein